MLSVVAKAFLSFALIIFLMLIVFYVLKRFYQPAFGSANSSGVMRIYGQLQIQPRKTIYIVRVLNKVLVIGASENSLTVLSEINDQEIIKALDEIYVSGERRNGKIFKLNQGGVR